MSLPIFQTTDKTLSFMQTNWATQINPVLALPINSGVLLQNISLTVGANAVNHKLGRKLQGWFIVRKRGSSDIYDTQDSNSTPALTLNLQVATAVSVDIYVF